MTPEAGPGMCFPQMPEQGPAKERPVGIRGEVQQGKEVCGSDSLPLEGLVDPVTRAEPEGEKHREGWRKPL